MKGRKTMTESIAAEFEQCIKVTTFNERPLINTYFYLVDRVLDIVKYHCEIYLIKLLEADNIPVQKSCVGNITEILHLNQVTRITLSKDPLNNQRVILSIATKPQNDSEVLHDYLPIQEGIVYNELHIAYTNELTAYMDGIGQFAIQMLSKGMKRVKSHVITMLDKAQYNVVRGLYVLLREIIPSNVVDLVLLGITIKEKGAYCGDSVLIDKVIAANERLQTAEYFDPLENAILLWMTSIPLDQMFTKEILRRNIDTLDNDLYKAKYAATQLNFAEIALFNSQMFSVTTIVRTDRLILTAAYPSDLKEMIEEPLLRDRARFIGKLEGIKKAVGNTPVSFLKSLYESDDLARFLGEFAGAFYKVISS
jgi:hypothetical protein